MRIIRKCSPIACIVLALLSSLVAAQAQINRLVVFGDSLSDPGNAFVLLGAASTPPDYSVDPFLVPDRPYARGGEHFSNGATWIEQLARPLGLAASTRPALRGAGGASNFAIGGARAGGSGLTDLGSQVEGFLAATGNRAPSDALYVVEIGGNDLRDALGALRVDPSFTTSLQILDRAAQAVGANVARLRDAGAARFLVWQVPNVAATPAIREIPDPGGSLASAAAFLTGYFNAALAAEVATVERIAVAWLPVDQLLATIIANPAGSGFANVTSACITPGVAPFQCQTPDQYLFWDGIHPTAAGHAIIAQQAAALLAH